MCARTAGSRTAVPGEAGLLPLAKTGLVLRLRMASQGKLEMG